MFVTRLVLVLSALAAACTSPSPESRVAEPADLVVSGSCSRQEDMLVLAVAVANRGSGVAQPSATLVDFDADLAPDVVRRTRSIAAHAVDTFEIELPAACAKVG